MGTEKELRDYVADFMTTMFDGHPELTFVLDDFPIDNSENLEAEFYGTVHFSKDGIHHEYEFQFTATFPCNAAFYIGEEGNTMELAEVNVWQYMYYYHAIPDPYNEDIPELNCPECHGKGSIETEEDGEIVYLECPVCVPTCVAHAGDSHEAG